MALFDNLKTVLTPYAEKINEHTTDISTLSGDVENVHADLNAAVDSLNGSLGDVKADLATFSETGYIPYYSADSIGGNGYVYTDVLLPAGKYKLTISNIVSSDSDRTVSTITFIQPNSGNVVYNLEHGVAIDLDFELTETCTRFICYASVSAGTSEGDSFTFSDVFIAKAVLNDVYTTIDNKTTIISDLDSNFVLHSSGQRLDWFMGKLDGESVIIDSIPQGYKVALNGYTSSSYAGNSKEFESGWISTAPVSLNINPALYYTIFIVKTGGGDTPIVVASDFSGRILKSSNNSIKTNSRLFENYELIASQTVKTIGHRGSDILAPENTAPSYIVAAKRGLKIVESDVFAKVDGNYVMWHDPTFAKLGNMVDITGKAIYTDGTGFYFYDTVNNLLYTYDFTNDEYVSSSESISNLSRCTGSSYTPTSFDFKMLRRIDVGVWKGSKYKGTTILTFNEFVLLCKQLGLEIYIDHKMSYTETVINELGAIVKNFGMLDHATWVQIPLELIPVLRTLDNNARIAQLYAPTQELINAYSQYNIGRGIVFNGNASDYTAEKVQLGLNNGFEVEAFYVDFGAGLTDEQNFTVLRNLVAYGVTGISTDHYRVEDAYRYLFNQY